MMYPHIILGDGTEITHSQVIHANGVDKVVVHFERPTQDGFDSARVSCPVIPGLTGKVISRRGRRSSSRSSSIATRIFCIAMLPMEASRLPSLFLVGGYRD